MFFLLLVLAYWYRRKGDLPREILPPLLGGRVGRPIAAPPSSSAWRALWLALRRGIEISPPSQGQVGAGKYTTQQKQAGV
jgi:hypothetical protein